MPTKRLRGKHSRGNIPTEPRPIPRFDRFGLIQLQGVLNCRDLGGMPTVDGRRIKKRRLIRSGDLHDATVSDMKQLVRMHDLEYVIDFRAPFEVKDEPDPLPLMEGIEYVDLPALTDDSIGFTGLKKGSLLSDVKALRNFNDDPFEFVREMYRKCILGEFGQKAYSTFLHDLLKAKEGASLWHCTQGKDRTGIASLLVEFSLGVSMENIRRDYLATNLFIKPWVDAMTGMLRNKVLIGGLGINLDAYTYAFMGYLNTALDVMVDSYGSVQNYLAKGLDFGPDKQEMLQRLYLE